MNFDICSRNSINPKLVTVLVDMIVNFKLFTVFFFLVIFTTFPITLASF